MIKKNPIRKREIAAWLLLYGANILLFTTIYFLDRYDKVALDQILFSLKSPGDGTASGMFRSAFFRVGVLGTAATLLQLLVCCITCGRFSFCRVAWYLRYCSGNACRRVKNLLLPITSILLAASIVFTIVSLQIVQYAIAVSTKSDFIEKYYVDPDEVTLTFPYEKKNLIYIVLESMENTFAQRQAGGKIERDYIPELSAMADRYINFSHNEHLGGAYSFDGATWTAASLCAQTSGIVVKVPVVGENYGENGTFISGLTSIGDILQEQGYNQTVLFGSDANFGGREAYFTEHGGYRILDIKSLKEQGRLPQDYKEWWGFEDEKLFAYAKEELTALAASGEPFNFTMLTADTHFPDGYLCRRCATNYDEQYANVLSCSAEQISLFIEWIKRQDFYDDTVIVLTGDHLTMDPEFLAGIDENYTRTVYNCFINAACLPVYEKNREFGVFDMFPTTLAAMGVDIEGERLGLGTNLFSAKDTLTEQFGYAYLNEELQLRSEFYNEALLEGISND